MGGDWRDKAGGLMCVGHSSASLCDGTRALLDAGVCGVILCASAFGEAEKTALLIHAIKQYAARPLFVGVEHETVEGALAHSGFTPLSLGRKLAISADVELSRHVGEMLGRQLRAVGVDMTLGPCLNVSVGNSPHSADQNLGRRAELVAKMGAALILGQQSEGVAACAMHFPGAGEVSHKERPDFPRRPHGISRLEEVELLPFRAAGAARVAGMVVGHLLLEALDDKLPASLSRAIVFGLLRQRLGYRGLVMIDDVDSLALGSHLGRDAIARLGVASGADCFLCGRRPETAFELISAIDRGVSEGAILPERIESARRRIAPLLHRYVRDPGSNPDLSRLGQERSGLSLGGTLLDPGIDSAPHVDPGALTAHKKQHHH